jgi:hypothetical protein
MIIINTSILLSIRRDTLLIDFGGERIEIKRKFREYKHKNNA